MNCDCRQGRNGPCRCKLDDEDPWWITALYNLAAVVAVLLTIGFVAVLVYRLWGSEC